jgi:hypothetical protein
MPLETHLSEFKRVCNSLIDMLKEHPELLTDAKRLDLETDVTRLITTIVQAQQPKKPQS